MSAIVDWTKIPLRWRERWKDPLTAQGTIRRPEVPNGVEAGGRTTMEPPRRVVGFDRGTTEEGGCESARRKRRMDSVAPDRKAW